MKTYKILICFFNAIISSQLSASDWLQVKEDEKLKAEYIFEGETSIVSFKYLDEYGTPFEIQPDELKLTVFGAELYNESDKVQLTLAFKPHGVPRKGDPAKIKKLRWTFINSNLMCPFFSYKKIGKTIRFYVWENNNGLAVRYDIQKTSPKTSGSSN